MAEAAAQEPLHGFREVGLAIPKAPIDYCNVRAVQAQRGRRPILVDDVQGAQRDNTPQLVEHGFFFLFLWEEILCVYCYGLKIWNMGGIRGNYGGADG